MYAFDGHKLDRYPDRLAAWQRGECVGPITVEVSPSAACNQRCRFCAFDYRRQGLTMQRHDILRVAQELCSCTINDRVQGVTWGGEGEPTLAKALPEALAITKASGIDNGLITNGTDKRIPAYLHELTWVRFSINSLKSDRYGKIHGTDPRNLTKVMKTLEACTAEKRPTTVGVQMLLFEENLDEVIDAAKRLRDVGVDYFVVKPYSRHPKSEHTNDFSLTSARLGSLATQLARVGTSTYHAELRLNSFEAHGQRKPYDHCLAAPFFHLITADMVVYPCAQFVGEREFALGSIHFQSWREFLISQRRHELLHYLCQLHETAGCRHPCRLDRQNRYLGALIDRAPHDGFI